MKIKEHSKQVREEVLHRSLKLWSSYKAMLNLWFENVKSDKTWQCNLPDRSARDRRVWSRKEVKRLVVVPGELQTFTPQVGGSGNRWTISHAVRKPDLGGTLARREPLLVKSNHTFCLQIQVIKGNGSPNRSISALRSLCFRCFPAPAYPVQTLHPFIRKQGNTQITTLSPEDYTVESSWCRGHRKRVKNDVLLQFGLHVKRFVWWKTNSAQCHDVMMSL